MADRPRGRDKRVTGSGNVFKQGGGLGLGGPAGKGGRGGNGLSGRPIGGGFGGAGGPRPGGPGRPTRGGGIGCGSIVFVIIAIIFYLVRGAASLLGGGDIAYESGYGSGSSSGYSSSANSGYSSGSNSGYSSQQSSNSLDAYGQNIDLSSIFGSNSFYGSNSGVMSGNANSNTIQTGGGSASNHNGKLNTSVSKEARDKYTVLKGNGKDTATVMVYMCGADLESQYGMGTSDLSEMTKAQIDDNVHVIVYTGGSRKWQNRIVSNQVNQIYEIKSGGVNRLEDSFSKSSMTEPDTLAEFIEYAADKFPADRYDLIFWDHGSGTAGGYGHDEKHANSGTMSLAGIDSALSKAGIKYDFIGFDACLMATLENALMLSKHADYLIASEETEPGTGWYYTGWLSTLSGNTAVSTPELGKIIADDFLTASQRARQGEAITLSVTDLSELGETVPAELAAFAKTTSDLIENDSYGKVSSARKNAKEFAQSNKLDQVDAADLALKLGTAEGSSLASAIKNAVKYNRTSNSYKDAHGLSIYFPYRKVSKLDSVISTYKKIGMDKDYMGCIKKFANTEVSGQAAGGSSNPYEALYGSSGATYSSSELTQILIESLLSGGYGRAADLDRSNTEFMDEDEIPDAAEYVSNNHINTAHLAWTRNKAGQKVLPLSEQDWQNINNLELSVLYDDGGGYIDLGLDTLYEYDDNDMLIGEYDNTWMAINGNPVAYYHLSTEEDGDEYSIHGYVPILLNGEYSDLLITFDNDDPYGRIDGVRYNYKNQNVEAVAKTAALMSGDEIEFVCDYYTYDGEFVDNYVLGNKLVVSGELEISNVEIGSAANAAYCITDIYNRSYWTEIM